MTKVQKYDISFGRKQQLSDLAEFIADYYFPHGSIEPELIAKDKGIKYNIDDYGDYFDGMLHCTDKKFHIFINAKRVDKINSTRGRFTFAHELGHYFIDEHRFVLENNLSKSHPSFIDFSSNNIVEIEADYFASSLLMPYSRLKRDIDHKKFSFNVINEIKNKYNTSYLATLIKFVSIGNHPILIVYSVAGKVKWYRYSEDFRFKLLRIDPYKNVPKNTSVGEYFYEGVMNKNSDEIVFSQDWFILNSSEEFGIQLVERCIYSPQNNCVVSVIWN